MTYSRPKVLLIIALGALVLTSRVASGQSATTHCLKIPACDTRYAQAQQLSKSSSHEEALAQFESLHAQYPDPVILYAIAIQLHRLGRHIEAISMYQRYLDSSSETDPARLATVRERLNNAQTELTAKNARQPSSNASNRTVTMLAAGSAPLASSSPQISTPTYKKWWLWTAVATAVVGVAVGASLGAYARPPSYPDAVALRPLP